MLPSDQQPIEICTLLEGGGYRNKNIGLRVSIDVTMNQANSGSKLQQTVISGSSTENKNKIINKAFFSFLKEFYYDISRRLMTRIPGNTIKCFYITNLQSDKTKVLNVSYTRVSQKK